MAHNRVFRITADELPSIPVPAHDQAMIDAYVQWLKFADQLDPLLNNLEKAFANLTLSDGTGLWEAKGIDDYASDEKLAALRSRDEHNDWRQIAVETLTRCYSAPTFMNARGFIFHLPAFLTAELNDKFSNGFIDRLIDPTSLPSGWIDLLNNSQRESIAAILELVAKHPEYLGSGDDIKMTIERLTGVS